MRYQRVFPRTLAGDDETEDYLRPQEYLDPDEDQFMAQIRDATVADTRRLPKHVGTSDRAFHEPHWGHTTGLLQGTLRIDRVGALPAQFRVGLFAEERSLPVVARPNFVDDRTARFTAARIAVKVKYPDLVPNAYAATGQAHELDLLFVAGSAELNGVLHSFLFRDARELAMFTTLKPFSRKTLATLLSLRNLAQIGRVVRRVKMANAFANSPASTTATWAGKTYYSLGPFALGDGAMKMCLSPREPSAIDPALEAITEPTERARAAMEAWIAAGKDSVFDLQVQLATPRCIPAPGPHDPPKSVMAAEYCDLDWDETVAPYVTVGTLTFRANEESDLSQTFPWSPLQFNSWNTLPSMRPLGQLFRARKHVHKAHSEVRLEHVYGATPGAMVDKAPYSDR